MNILVVGSDAHFQECQQKFGSTHRYQRQSTTLTLPGSWDTTDIIFDFVSSSSNEVACYHGFGGDLFLNACRLSLAEFFPSRETAPTAAVYGFNGMPTFLDRELLEVSLLDPRQSQRLAMRCEKLSTSFRLVDDRVGLVSGRIIAMVINEAYCAAQEGIASLEDIDNAMRLGTNYPWGPFEWAKRIGLAAVYELIESLYRDTHDERYKVCPMLKKEYLRQVKSLSDGLT